MSINWTTRQVLMNQLAIMKAIVRDEETAKLLAPHIAKTHHLLQLGVERKLTRIEKRLTMVQS